MSLYLSVYHVSLPDPLACSHSIRFALKGVGSLYPVEPASDSIFTYPRRSSERRTYVYIVSRRTEALGPVPHCLRQGTGVPNRVGLRTWMAGKWPYDDTVNFPFTGAPCS